jgi:hypothetical protein
MRYHNDTSKDALIEDVKTANYERPTLTPVGNLRDVVATSTQSLDCDDAIPAGGEGHNAC